ncbi:hypothetical protein BX661DRAFT_184508 [Kickxella alabastrina]|uniref:uncharacterized protein n=1 Tax=Kickxella alabastrina TaxID=61397 RepID=UPI00221EF2E6|nr:uncharacterized protein BX661DRAFT_184508 [Kickxella alabastrina]KAI7825423.1 hypothetical protein BX661DRAFT_184508 [Kickxella alabastrina]
MKSYLVPDSAEQGYSAIMRRGATRTAFYELFQHRVNISPNTNLIGSRRFDPLTRKFGAYEWTSAAQAAELVEQFGCGLDHQALGIYSINRPEWLLAEFAGFRSSKYSVALYDTLGADSIEFIIEHSSVAVVVCSIDKVPKLLKLKDKLPSLQAIISMDLFADHGKNPVALPFTVNSIRVLHEWAKSKGVALYDMSELHTPRLPKPSDLCTICYTSGTTGEPKGAMATHASYAFSAKSGSVAVPCDNSVYMSFLPLAHCFERNIIYAGMALHPTVMAGVPRLFNRIYDRIAAATLYGPGLSGVIARTAIRQKMERLEAGHGTTHPFWDRIVCKKIRQAFGGCLEVMISGSAPIDAKVLNFLRVALAGYASTECNATATVSLYNENKAGHVGVPNPGIDIRLRDVPEMNYLATDKPCPRGEVLIRGKSTKAVFDGEWLITGDVGQFNEDGNLKIIDRRKNILKLAQGEYVAVEFLETVYSRCPLIQNIFVHGDSLQSSLVAVVVPDPETFLPWAQKITGNKVASLAELCKNEQVVGALLVELRVLGRETKLQGFEIVREIHCDSVPFDIEGNGLLTATFKLKRNIAKEYYAMQIQNMYAKITKPK